MSMKLQKIFLGILVAILTLLTVPKLINYGMELWDYIEVEVFSWHGGYRIIDNYEMVMQVISTITFLTVTLIVLFVKKFSLFIKNIIVLTFIIALILIAQIWYSTYSEKPWLYNNRVQYNGLGEYTHLHAN